jgi:hypothetical protein
MTIGIGSICSAGIRKRASHPERHPAGLSPVDAKDLAHVDITRDLGVTEWPRSALLLTEPSSNDGFEHDAEPRLQRTPKEGSCHEFYFSDRRGDSCAGIHCGLRPEAWGLVPQLCHSAQRVYRFLRDANPAGCSRAKDKSSIPKIDKTVKTKP